MISLLRKKIKERTQTTKINSETERCKNKEAKNRGIKKEMNQR